MNKLYLKLAWSNLKNSRQFYLPYVIAGMLSAMMFYTMCAIQGNEGLSKMRGGASVQMVLFFGVIVVGVFVSIFLFYTNSFIMKRRKKELGIYNILGMEKRHIAVMMFFENVFVTVHRKPENCGAKSCECMISVHREARYCERSEQ